MQSNVFPAVSAVGVIASTKIRKKLANNGYGKPAEVFTNNELIYNKEPNKINPSSGEARSDYDDEISIEEKILTYSLNNGILILLPKIAWDKSFNWLLFTCLP